MEALEEAMKVVEDASFLQPPIRIHSPSTVCGCGVKVLHHTPSERAAHILLIPGRWVWP